MWLGDQFFIYFNKLPFNAAYKRIQIWNTFIANLKTVTFKGGKHFFPETNCLDLEGI